ncbi:hypothetical protein A1O7_05149 [Cladophialophora yegresii CBS 114405]|uniref:Uncharacterized protein n=1 Tax=Cladophialophora yegresii CBS 114405 TaxID=1182544 RepID=W9W8Y5_9EURO|nr:uncharacterized protein A1O7_05149 [Cladophialophora yegresii CBS 114405]EXJ60996.1 hypothetical protein A1O7_05149 [Cladophialophora yegresii CBS 114405]
MLFFSSPRRLDRLYSTDLSHLGRISFKRSSKQPEDWSGPINPQIPKAIIYNLGAKLDLERQGGSVVMSRDGTRRHYEGEGHALDMAWYDLDLLYFRGYAISNYLVTPFYFT